LSDRATPASALFADEGEKMVLAILIVVLGLLAVAHIRVRSRRVR
jgi:hypothetical protein